MHYSLGAKQQTISDAFAAKARKPSKKKLGSKATTMLIDSDTDLQIVLSDDEENGVPGVQLFKTKARVYVRANVFFIV